MSHVYVTSDWHIGHKGITDKFRTQFPNIETHDNYILSRVLGLLSKRDILYVLGDVAMSQSALDLIKEYDFPCKMYLVRGNHDQLPTIEYLEVFDEVYGAFRYKKYWFTHIPIHPRELFKGMNVHGHCHRGGPYEVEEDTRYFNAILEFNDYLPINMQKLGTIIAERYNNKRLRKLDEREEHSGECDPLKESV